MNIPSDGHDISPPGRREYQNIPSRTEQIPATVISKKEISIPLSKSRIKKASYGHQPRILSHENKINKQNLIRSAKKEAIPNCQMSPVKISQLEDKKLGFLINHEKCLNGYGSFSHVTGLVNDIKCSQISKTNLLLISKHPPPKTELSLEICKKSDFFIFIKSNMKIISVVHRALKMLEYVKEKNLNTKHITLKALGRAIDTAIIVGTRLQLLGYSTRFTTSTESLIDEMAIQHQEINEDSVVSGTYHKNDIGKSNLKDDITTFPHKNKEINSSEPIITGNYSTEGTDKFDINDFPYTTQNIPFHRVRHVTAITIEVRTKSE